MNGRPRRTPSIPNSAVVQSIPASDSWRSSSLRPSLPGPCLVLAMASVCGTKRVVRNYGSSPPAYRLIQQKPLLCLAAGLGKELTKFTCGPRECSVRYPTHAEDFFPRTPIADSFESGDGEAVVTSCVAKVARSSRKANVGCPTEAFVLNTVYSSDWYESAGFLSSRMRQRSRL
jgi:hypothetical protein